MNYVEQLYSTNIKLRAFEDTLAETMVLIQIFVTTLSIMNIFKITTTASESAHQEVVYV